MTRPPLKAVASLLPYYDIDPAKVHILGTGLWDDPGLGTEPALEPQLGYYQRLLARDEAEAGQVVESGRHEKLLRKGGRYASFYRLQLKEQGPTFESLAVG